MPIVLANITIIICSGNAGKVLLSYVALSIIYLNLGIYYITYLPPEKIRSFTTSHQRLFKMTHYNDKWCKSGSGYNSLI